MSEGKENDEFIFYGFIPGTLIDYPGCVAATVFTIGCNFRCPYCQNRDLVLSQTESLPEHPVGAVLDQIAPDRGSWTDGICITGGEPLLSTGIEGALRKFKETGLKVKLDTNGSLPKRLLRLIRDGLLDYVAMDVKAPLTEREYSKAIGLPAGPRLPALRESIDLLKESGIEVEFRTTCVPGLHTPEVIGRLARDIAPCGKYFLQPFRPHDTLDPAYEDVPEPGPQEMKDMLAAARQYISAAEIR